MSDLAEKLFETGIQHSLAEADVSELLIATYGNNGYADWSHDYYDRSIEVYECTPSGAAFDALQAAGFSRIWQHGHPMGKPHKIDCGCKAARPE